MTIQYNTFLDLTSYQDENPENPGQIPVFSNIRNV